MPGRPLVRLHDPKTFRVTAPVPLALAPALQGAAALDVELAAQRITVPGAAVQMLPAVDAATHTAQARIALPQTRGLAPGMFARVWLPASAAGPQRLVVPSAALVRRAELTGVYVLGEAGRPLLRQVRAGRTDGGWVEILSGVRPGDKVATDPQAAAKVR